jgi:hypothetical protein
MGGIHTGAPAGVSCTICTSGAFAARYFSRSVEIALRVWEMFSVFRRPSMYLFEMTLC